MQMTEHIQQRMSQRGVSREMVDLVLAHGTLEQDKHVLGVECHEVVAIQACS